MATLASLQERIEKLQQEAEQLRKAGLSDVIARIREAVAEYGLTPAIFDRKGQARPRGERVVVKGARTPRPPKYRDPKTGKTWNGLGKPPDWIAGARNRDKFLIDASSAGSEGAPATAQLTPAKKVRKAAVLRSRAAKPVTKKASKSATAKKAAEQPAEATEARNAGAAT